MTLALFACSTAPPPAAPPASTRPVEVLLVPVGEFPPQLAAGLARDLTSDVDVQVCATSSMAAGDLRPRSAEQYSAEEIVARAASFAAAFPNRHAPSIAVALTTFDINEASGSLKFVFAHRHPASHTSVLSVARLGFTTTQVAATPTVIYERIYKMIKRTIGVRLTTLKKYENWLPQSNP